MNDMLNEESQGRHSGNATTYLQASGVQLTIERLDLSNKVNEISIHYGKSFAVMQWTHCAE